MRPLIGTRDTLITFQSRTGTQDGGTGAWTYSWANLGSNPTEWADVKDVLPSRGEQVAENVDLSNRPCRVRCLYRSDITAEMRVVIEGRSGAYAIVSGPVELGRKDGLEMICEQVSTEGDAP